MKSIKYIFSGLLGLLVGLSTSFFVNDFGFFQPFFEAVLIALIGSLCSFFLDFCFREGNIFAGWIRFLNKYFHENEKNPFRFLYKPLGACAFCLNIWLSLGFFMAYYLINGISFLWLLPVAFISHLMLFYLSKHFDLDS
jgi:hypothetical protein